MKRRLLFFTFAFFAITLLNDTRLFAEDSANELGAIDQKLAILEVKLNRLSTVQTQIIQKQTEIKQELDTLRIWIRRNH